MTVRKIALIIIFFLFSICSYLQYRSTQDMEAWWGTAWMLNDQGYMVTAAHVVGKHATLQVMYRGTWYKAIPVAVDYTHDVAIIKTKLKGVPFYPITYFLQNTVNAHILGFPVPEVKGFIVKQTKGAANTGGWNGKYINFTINICPGNSGGPILDSGNRAVGVVTNRRVYYEFDDNHCSTQGYGPSSYYVKDLADKYHINYTLEDNFTTGGTHGNQRYSDSVLLVYGANNE